MITSLSSTTGMSSESSMLVIYEQNKVKIIILNNIHYYRMKPVFSEYYNDKTSTRKYNCLPQLYQPTSETAARQIYLKTSRCLIENKPSTALFFPD